MNFNMDDPLAGILSDGSDDSFFDDDILGKKKPAKKANPRATENKNALFEIEQAGKPATKLKPDIATKDVSLEFSKEDARETKLNTTSPGPTKRVSKDSFKLQPLETKTKTSEFTPKSPAKATALNILDLLDEPKNDRVAPEKGKSSQSLLDDILGGPTSKSSNVTKNRPATTVNTNFDLDTFLGNEDTKPPSNKGVLKKPNKTDNPKKESQLKPKVGADWLGVFQEDTEVDGDDGDMPAWLVGGDKKKKTEKKPKDDIEKKEVKEESNVENKTEHHLESEKPRAVLAEKSSDLSPPTIIQANNEDITAEGATLFLKQQDSQLMLALQLKAQEEKLAAIQLRQQESQRVQKQAAMAHHAQLNAMLQKQAENRSQMQTIINAHQERINQRIKALLGTQNTIDEEGHADGAFEMNVGDGKETPQRKENKQLLQLIQSLQENHDKEIDLMETSYRRQLAFLELSVHQSEERMKEESDKLVKFYSEKIGWLEEHHLLFKKMTEDNLSALTDRHKAENDMLRHQHLDNVRILQEHHAALMENIKNAVKQEQILIKDSVSFSSDLSDLVAEVRETKTNCQLLVNKVETFSEANRHDTEKSLQTRETQINDMIQHLKRERENFDIEKNESRDIVRMLEARLKQMTATLEEETALLKQKRMEFEFEKATFNKQTEFAKNVLKKQDDEIKTLREDIQKEYQEKIAKIDDEKVKTLKDSSAVAKDKAAVQSLKQELEKMKAELQAQLEELTEERTKLNVEKQQVHMEEQRTVAKSRDLDLLAKTAIEKQSQADKKYSEAEFLQRKYEERIRRIHEHVVSLNAREKQIAREKVALSRERLNLHNERRQIEGKQCSLCKSTQNLPFSLETNYNVPDSYLNVSVSRDPTKPNVSSAMNAIEQEMAHLMSANFSLRHTPGVSDVSEVNRFVGGEALDGTIQNAESQLGSGAFKDYMDPKFMMLRLDVQKVLSNIDQSKNGDIKYGHSDED
ncbi:fas-binding factor 1 homolog [Bombyx mandarina]|uniref:Fas-binding factor 1 homolog n=1 Tax=Bombyx mandarina TaxID=7092 RepID=A0A6J2KAB6_BOMMA|nr:fas-binding factor 1 homolog [Bombyx mandarina]